MKLEELVGKYRRLRAEFSNAHEAEYGNAHHLSRLGDEIASTERAIAMAQPLDEQTSDQFPELFS